MRALELKIPPVLVLLLVGAAMAAVDAAAVVPLELPLAGRAAAAGVLFALGVGVAVAGVLAFRRVRTTVNPTRPEASTAIVSTGIYAFSRNPMYLGMLLVLAAWGAWLADPLALLGPPVFVLWMNLFQIRPEERALASRFGPVYQDYLRSVRRWV